MEYQAKNPVLFVIFNRPREARIVFDQIKKVKPKQLFIAADGPRPNKPNDQLLCAETRSIAEEVDWDCDLQLLFRDENLGCGKGVYTAINWFFDHVDQGMVLEDDCVPNNSYFYFCDEMLEFYKDTESVMQITGCNFQKGNSRSDGSYYFSNFSYGSGWATWKRAWKFFDNDIKTFPLFSKTKFMSNVFPDKLMAWYYHRKFVKVYEKEITTAWDFQWSYAIFIQGGKCIVPNVNLTKNIGYGLDSTHTAHINKNLANIEVVDLNNIIHPTLKIKNYKADKFYFYNYVWGNLLAKIGL